MAFTDNGMNYYMPVSPSNGCYGNNCGGFGDGFGGNGAWWLLVLFLFAGFNGNNGWGNGNNGTIPYVMNNNTSNEVQRGFDQQAVMSGISGVNSAITSGFANNATALCNGFAGVNATINSGFSAAEASENARQIANMQQQFNSQTAISNGMNNIQSQLSQCCCDNRLATANLQSTILAENCADRTALADGVRDILVNNTANTQRIVDTTNNAIQGIYNKICQLELDAKNTKIAELQSQLTMAQITANNNAQTAAILANNEAQTSALEQYLAPVPKPAYIVQNPNGCNCGNNYFNGGCCAA